MKAIIPIITITLLMVLGGCGGSGPPETQSGVIEPQPGETESSAPTGEKTTVPGPPEDEVSPPSSPASVTITYPSSGSKVAMREIIRGVTQNLGEDKNLMVILFIPEIGRHYPQAQQPAVHSNGNWEAEAWFGGTGDSGLRFEVEAVLVNVEARGALENYFSNCEKANSWPGMIELPEGTEVCHTVNVVRE
ncbi:MAG: hypothetical protein KKB90_13335 [Actinobacteria bacterium]|nr:hypothetical protein [Actinomycetota bacterium]